KVERFSDVGLGDSPISSRTRKTSAGKSQKEQEPHKSIYEDALAEEQVKTASTTETFTPPATTAEVAVNEHVTISTTTPINQTITLGGAPADATFCTNAAQTTFQIAPGQSTFIVDNPNATITLNKNADPSTNAATDVGDATFNVAANDANKSNRSSTLSRQSMVTAKDTSHPQDTSLITEDESFEQPIAKSQPMPPHAPKAPTALKLHTQTKVPLSAKGYKVPSRTNELFNPLVQSPVKKKVEAFEHALQAATIEQSKTGTLRPKRLKETSTTHTTPVIGGKIYAPAIGKFLTPTQSSTVTPNIGQMRKLPNSTSKTIGFPKTNLKPTTSASAKALSRDNTSDDLRKGLSQQAEERKKLREQKHVLAAQQREMREKERTERMAKQAKEREEKRIKKQLEIEKKKREQEDIQLKLRQQEEAAAEAAAMKQRVAKAKAIAEQEQEHLAQIEKAKQGTLSKKKMMPPPNPKPEVKSSYTFDMLHEDDSTDDEDKVSYKRPPPPEWSKSTTRGPAIRMQEHCWSEIIDNMFSVEPVTVNLKEIFPNISSQHLKRNSSVMWSTPPRYSELPKY
ncbi:MAP7 domain-containing protein 1-like, partial [Teleopsis dalmanni]|uniref:MAP7 domain-containing protein 1-like n=1 Tax=Teleopsis dalmanni TaxID=139649 RepID=UPI0018CCB407